MTRALAVSLCIMLFILAGFGCAKQPDRVFNIPATGSVRPSIRSEHIRTNPASVGVLLGDIASTNGEWHAYGRVESDKSVTLVVEGRGMKKEVPIAAPVSFSPDSKTLIFSGDSGYGTLGLYLLALPPRQSARRITNTVKIRNEVGGKSLVPVPVDGSVGWTGKKMRYTVPNEGVFELDLATQKVLRVSP